MYGELCLHIVAVSSVIVRDKRHKILSKQCDFSVLRFNVRVWYVFIC